MAQPGKDAMFTPVPSAADNEVDDQTLQLQKVDLKTDENGKKHRTSKYYLKQGKSKADPKLIVRRGQEFSLELEFNRPYQKGSDAVKLHLIVEGYEKKGSASVPLSDIPGGKGKTIGEKLLGGTHNYHKNCNISYVPSQVHVNVEDGKSSSTTNGWLAYVASSDGNKITLKVQPPAKCAVAKWEVEVELTSQKSPSSRKYQLKNPIYILFNPWCSEDATFYPSNPKDLDEYVLSDKGAIYRGSANSPDLLFWDYDQFNPGVLDCVMHLLDHECERENRLTVPERGDVVKVTRRITSVINSDQIEPDGVLEGRWLDESTDEAYKREGGKNAKNPNSWRSSSDILLEYYEAKQKNPDKVAAVKFGQCWVFAGVLTTVCRALGIPSRPITNFNSGHEKKSVGFSFTIDEYFDAKTEKKIVSETDDSVWDFHVWSEAWMKREDIPKSDIYTGWQAIDATAQEVSDQKSENCSECKTPQVYVLGPAPVAACLRGDVDASYDVDFLFGEVNSMRVQWKVVNDGTKKSDCERKCNFWRIDKHRDAIGARLVTRFANQLLDVTESYKYKDPAKAKDAMRNALEQCCLDSARITQAQISELEMNVEVTEDYIGKPIKLNVKLASLKNEKYEGHGLVQVYTARQKYVQKNKLVAEFPLKFSVGPSSKDSHEETFIIEYEKYKDIMKTADVALYVDYSAGVDDRNIYDIGKIFFCFKQLDMQIEAPESVGVEGTFKVKATLKNPLSVPIEKGTFKVSAKGLKIDPKEKKLEKKLEPGKEASVEFELTPEWGAWASGAEAPIAIDFSSTHPVVSAHGYTEVAFK